MEKMEKVNYISPKFSIGGHVGFGLVGFGNDSVQILMDQFECYLSNPDLVMVE